MFGRSREFYLYQLQLDNIWLLMLYMFNILIIYKNNKKFDGKHSAAFPLCKTVGFAKQYYVLTRLEKEIHDMSEFNAFILGTYLNDESHAFISGRNRKKLVVCVDEDLKRYSVLCLVNI